MTDQLALPDEFVNTTTKKGCFYIKTALNLEASSGFEPLWELLQSPA